MDKKTKKESVKEKTVRTFWVVYKKEKQKVERIAKLSGVSPSQVIRDLISNAS